MHRYVGRGDDAEFVEAVESGGGRDACCLGVLVCESMAKRGEEREEGVLAVSTGRKGER